MSFRATDFLHKADSDKGTDMHLGQGAIEEAAGPQGQSEPRDTESTRHDPEARMTAKRTPLKALKPGHMFVFPAKDTGLFGVGQIAVNFSLLPIALGQARWGDLWTLAYPMCFSSKGAAKAWSERPREATPAIVARLSAEHVKSGRWELLPFQGLPSGIPLPRYKTKRNGVPTVVDFLGRPLVAPPSEEHENLPAYQYSSPSVFEGALQSICMEAMPVESGKYSDLSIDSVRKSDFGDFSLDSNGVLSETRDQ